MEGIKTRLKLELLGSWVLEKRNAEVLPIEQFINSWQKLFPEDTWLERVSLTSCSIIFPYKKGLAADLEELTRDILQEKLLIDDVDKIAEIYIEEVEEEVKPETGSDGKEENKKDAEMQARQTTPQEKIQGLVGVQGFKALARELVEIAPQIKKHKTHESFYFQTYLFSVGEGCGLTTCLQLFSQLIEELKLFAFTPGQKVQEVLMEPGKEGIKEALEKAEGLGVSRQLICFDISEWMTQLKRQEFRRFLKKLENMQAHQIFAFRIPFVDEQAMGDVREALGNILFVRGVSLPPFTQEELREYAGQRLQQYEFSMEEDGWGVFDQRIIEEKSDGMFYGLNTVDKIVKEILYQKQLSNTRQKVDELLIREKDIKTLAASRDSGQLNALEQLDRLIGIPSVKQHVQEMVAQIQLSMRREEFERPCLHMRFVGNPGTGKTTVARLLGKILKEKGILTGGHLFEYSGRDFCGRYVGETAPKTTAMCRDAYGSVLFIDEAYSLYRGNEDTNDFGREALDVLVAEMENHRADLIVVMAGYPEEMDIMMRGNTGLASRMPYKVEFSNYTRDELFAIFMSMAREKFTIEEGFGDAVEAYFQALGEETITSKEFSNARFVRNLFERTWGKAALRQQFENTAPHVLTRCDFEKASTEREFFDLTHRRKRNIGF